jgi:hypothetical protein
MSGPLLGSRSSEYFHIEVSSPFYHFHGFRREQVGSSDVVR